MLDTNTKLLIIGLVLLVVVLLVWWLSKPHFWKCDKETKVCFRVPDLSNDDTDDTSLKAIGGGGGIQRVFRSKKKCLTVCDPSS